MVLESSMLLRPAGLTATPYRRPKLKEAERIVVTLPLCHPTPTPQTCHFRKPEKSILRFSAKLIPDRRSDFTSSARARWARFDGIIRWNLTDLQKKFLQTLSTRSENLTSGNALDLKNQRRSGNDDFPSMKSSTTLVTVGLTGYIPRPFAKP
jgi:hypothetical protein